MLLNVPGIMNKSSSMNKSSRLGLSAQYTGSLSPGSLTTKSYENRKLTEFPKVPNAQSLLDLRMTGNPIKDFVGLQRMEKLQVLKVDNTEISSFIGACEQPNLTYLSLEKTPLFLFQYHRLMARMVFGPSLTTVCGKPISKEEHRLAEKLNPLLRDYLLKGWVITSMNPVRLYNVASRARLVFFQSGDFENIPSVFEPGRTSQ